MGVTGWLGEAPDEVPPMPVTEMLLARQQRRAGPLETALARSAASDIREAREAAANAPDPDERAANLVSRGYTPGLASQLAQRLGDTMAEIEAENAKIEKGKRRQEHLHRAHAAGQITAWDIVRGQDFDEGDPGRVAMLERRAASLRAQIEDAQAVIAPAAQRVPDPVEAASRAAHEVFREVTRAAWEAAQSGTARPAPRERRPFASVSRSGGTEQHTGPDCRVCAAAREQERARALEDAAAVYGPGEVITTGYQQGMAYR
jgi:hypothetical protein